MDFLLKVIITDNLSKGFIMVDSDTSNLILQKDLCNATSFSQEFSDDMYAVLCRARKSFEGHKFRVVSLDDSLVNSKFVLKSHLNLEDYLSSDECLKF